MSHIPNQRPISWQGRHFTKWPWFAPHHEIAYTHAHGNPRTLLWHIGNRTVLDDGSVFARAQISGRRTRPPAGSRFLSPAILPFSH